MPVPALPHPATGPARRPGERLVAAGAALFALGTLAAVATVVPLFLGLPRLPTAAYLLAMLAPVGFALALAGLVRAARSRRTPRRREPPQR